MKICEDCKHLIRHYTQVGNGYFRKTECGSCMVRRIRDVTVLSSCEKYKKAEETTKRKLLADSLFRLSSEILRLRDILRENDGSMK